jgi:hypothetical protein
VASSFKAVDRMPHETPCDQVVRRKKFVPSLQNRRALQKRKLAPTDGRARLKAPNFRLGGAARRSPMCPDRYRYCAQSRARLLCSLSLILLPGHCAGHFFAFGIPIRSTPYWNGSEARSRCRAQLRRRGPVIGGTQVLSCAPLHWLKPRIQTLRLDLGSPRGRQRSDDLLHPHRVSGQGAIRCMRCWKSSDFQFETSGGVLNWGGPAKD